MTTLDKAYTELTQVLALPGYFGRNLDALEECLREVTEVGAITLAIHQSHHLQSLPEWPDILAILEENGKISIVLD